MVRIRVNEGIVAVGPGSGRGAWIGPSQECLSLAVKKRAIGKALRTALEADQLASITCSWSTGPAACEHGGT